MCCQLDVIKLHNQLARRGPRTQQGTKKRNPLHASQNWIRKCFSGFYGLGEFYSSLSWFACWGKIKESNKLIKRGKHSVKILENLKRTKEPTNLLYWQSCSKSCGPRHFCACCQSLKNQWNSSDLNEKAISHFLYKYKYYWLKYVDTKDRRANTATERETDGLQSKKAIEFSIFCCFKWQILRIQRVCQVLSCRNMCNIQETLFNGGNGMKERRSKEKKQRRREKQIITLCHCVQYMLWDQ